MDSIVAVLTQNIIPIFIVAGFGYALRRWFNLEKRSLSAAVFNLLSPCLVFASLVNSQLPGDELVDLTSFALLTITTMGVIGWLAARIFRLSRRNTAALLLMTMFVNGGNYGLTLNQLRYGEAGLSRAVVYYTTSTVLIYTLGMFIAASGRLNGRDALARLLRLPPVYAAVAAIVVYRFDLTVPTPLMRGIEVAGAGAIPVMLLVLGMQLADTQRVASWRLALPTISLRLLVGPLVAMTLAVFIGLEGVGRSTSIIEASMPPAVFTTILATEFDLQPTAVTGIVVLATLLSPLTVAATITLLGL